MMAVPKVSITVHDNATVVFEFTVKATDNDARECLETALKMRDEKIQEMFDNANCALAAHQFGDAN